MQAGWPRRTNPGPAVRKFSPVQRDYSDALFGGRIALNFARHSCPNSSVWRFPLKSGSSLIAWPIPLSDCGVRTCGGLRRPLLSAALVLKWSDLPQSLICINSAPLIVTKEPPLAKFASCACVAVCPSLSAPIISSARNSNRCTLCRSRQSPRSNTAHLRVSDSKFSWPTLENQRDVRARLILA